MLILTRRPVETIYIGDEVTITVLGVVGNQVRFGIEAPRSITIDRAEIHERKKRAATANGNGASRNEVNGNVDSSNKDERLIPEVAASPPQVDGNVAVLKLRR